MQLMEATADEVAIELGINDVTNEMLVDPQINIKLGIKYFSNLLRTI